MRPPRSPSADLFPDDPVEQLDRAGFVDLVMVYVHETDKAWLLRRSGRKAEPQWIAKSTVTRGTGLDADVFTMTRGAAQDRGWL